MKRLFCVCLALVTICVGASAQENVPAASPEMAKVAKALAGDWNTTENIERGDLFPNGGTRRGRTHVTLTAGGTTCVTWPEEIPAAFG